eukprot:TRINITY_DN6399_c3_g1_i1.p1 TRINITY_DN6399_c3_g1~~TRINITY_DN6399_c3_g1_i1.p1  ORF type:complete len:185 (-),score=15.39 TRINITY_DN6399_c3_g1_i1:150-704(-)
MGMRNSIKLWLMLTPVMQSLPKPAKDMNEASDLNSPYAVLERSSSLANVLGPEPKPAFMHLFSKKKLIGELSTVSMPYGDDLAPPVVIDVVEPCVAESAIVSSDATVSRAIGIDSLTSDDRSPPTQVPEEPISGSMPAELGHLKLFGDRDDKPGGDFDRIGQIDSSSRTTLGAQNSCKPSFTAV